LHSLRYFSHRGTGKEQVCGKSTSMLTKIENRLQLYKIGLTTLSAMHQMLLFHFIKIYMRLFEQRISGNN